MTIAALNFTFLSMLAVLSQSVWATSQELLPDAVALTADKELTFSWQNQGTLVCNGVELNSTVSIPQDLAYGSVSECWVQFVDARSNPLTLDCIQSRCIVSGMGQSKTFEFDQEDYAVAAPQDTTSELIVTAIKPPEEEEPVVSSVQKQRFPKHWKTAGHSGRLKLPKNHYAVQLVANEKRHAIDTFLMEQPFIDAFPDVMTVPIESNGKIMFALVSGFYPTYQEAQDASRVIEQSLALEPWIRSVASLKRAIKRARVRFQADD